MAVPLPILSVRLLDVCQSILLASSLPHFLARCPVPRRLSVGYGMIDWMRKRGWTVEAPWPWRSELSPALRVDLTPDSRQPEARGRAMRQGWRMFALRCFLRSERHEAKDMLNGATEEVLLQRAEEVDFHLLREFLLQSAAQRTAMLAALVSPAWLMHCEGTDPAMHCCPRCGRRAANFRHVVYTCPRLGEGNRRRRMVPDTPWQARLGWPVKGVSKALNKARLDPLVNAVLLLWQQRHENPYPELEGGDEMGG